MSDDEEQVMSEEEGEEQAPARREAADSGPSEAQLAMQRRRGQQEQQYSGLDDAAQEVLEANRAERALMEDEIRELRERSERRKREREEEERRLAEQRAAEDARRKAEEEERRRKKEEEEREKREKRQAKMAEFEKWKQPPKANFVITKKSDGGVSFGNEDGEEDAHVEKKSREQLEAEKQAILAQRVPKIEGISDMDTSKLTEKAKELHSLIIRVESEKYDLEKRFKAQQYDMMELAERARQMVKVGKQGMIKRKQLADDETDTFGEKFAGCPSKIEMYSKYERQKDKRNYGDRREIFTGPVYGYPADRIVPQRVVQWGEDGLPIYADLEGAEAPAEGGEE
jgi:troponin T